MSSRGQKVIRQNSNSMQSMGGASMSSSMIGAHTGGNHKPSEYAENDDGEFKQIIADIMRGFGDCDRPLKETVQLVEKILLQQLHGILNDVIDVSVARRGAIKPTQGDFEFLMRNNPTKVHRLQKHIKDLQNRRMYEERIKGRPLLTENDELDTNGAQSDEDQDREVAEQYDEEKTRRVFRADRISQALNGAQYMEYNEARRSSFYLRNSQKIRNRIRSWIKTETLMSNRVFTILSYLAHETIATIVDFAILTRLNSANRLHEPFHRVISSKTSYTMLHLCPEVTQGRGQDGMKPITVSEIHEAMRRHAMYSTRTMGLHRNLDRNRVVPYLAL